ncbi:MAG: hypothetical protein QM747_20230 [Nocardioides sp.]
MKTRSHHRRGVGRAASLVAAVASVAAIGIGTATEASAASVSAWGGPPAAYFQPDAHGARVMLKAKAVAGAKTTPDGQVVTTTDYMLSGGTYTVEPDTVRALQDVEVIFTLESAPAGNPKSFAPVPGQTITRRVDLTDGVGHHQEKTLAGPDFTLRQRQGTDARVYRVVVDFNWYRHGTNEWLSSKRIWPSLKSELACGSVSTLRCSVWEYGDGVAGMLLY